jgi:tetratricopeptide (TPR) repeat protein
MWGYRTGDVARMLGLSEARVRGYARAGFVNARRGRRGELRFSFQDLVLLRAASGLLSSRVPPRRVRRSLSRLRQQLPDGHSLAAVRISADGDRVVVRDGRAAWNPDSGQGLLDFGVAEVAERVAPLLERAARPGSEPLDAGSWYAWGCDLEDGAPEQAKEAYRRVLALDPAHAGAHLNLGRLLHQGGDAAGAESHYRRALAAAPDDPIAAFDLGVALEDRGRDAEAPEAYRRALDADPGLADAHHNAARICERLGQGREAVRHLGAYRRLVRG